MTIAPRSLTHAAIGPILAPKPTTSRVDRARTSRFDGIIGGISMADSAGMEGSGDTVLRIRLFGPASFTIAARDLRFKSLKLRAALGYIALSESQTETRERLVGLLWSESGEDHARAMCRGVAGKQKRAGENPALLVFRLVPLRTKLDTQSATGGNSRS